MSGKPNLACDLDSVLAATDGAALDRMNRDFGTSFTVAAQVEWAFETNLVGICDDPAGYVGALFGDPGFYRDLALILPMKTVLTKLKQHFREIQIVTARPDNCRGVTQLWLNEYGITYDRLVLTSEKGRYCREADCAYLIEDAPHHALSALEHGIGVFLIDKPYNQSIEARGGLWRVDNPLEIVPLLKTDLTRFSRSVAGVASDGGSDTGSVSR